MKKKEKERINELAALFYKSQGYHAEDGFDFSKSSHGGEQAMWNQALIAHCFFTGRFEDLKHQV